MGYDGDFWVSKRNWIGRIQTDGTWLADLDDSGAQQPIFQGPNNHMWLGYSDYLAELDASGAVTYNAGVCSNGGFNTYSITYDADENLIWCYSETTGGNGISSYDPVTRIIRNYAKAGLAELVYGVLVDTDDSIWFKTVDSDHGKYSISHLRRK